MERFCARLPEYQRQAGKTPSLRISLMLSQAPPYQEHLASDPQCPGREEDGVSERGGHHGFSLRILDSPGELQSGSGYWAQAVQVREAGHASTQVPSSSSFLLAGTTWFAWAKRAPWPSWTSCKFCHLLAYVYTV